MTSGSRSPLVPGHYPGFQSPCGQLRWFAGLPDLRLASQDMCPPLATGLTATGVSRHDYKYVLAMSVDASFPWPTSITASPACVVPISPCYERVHQSTRPRRLSCRGSSTTSQELDFLKS